MTVSRTDAKALVRISAILNIAWYCLGGVIVEVYFKGSLAGRKRCYCR